MADTAEVQLRRLDTTQPWGFRMQGGSEFGVPLYAAQVSPNSVSGKAGLRPGDAIIKICGTSVEGWTHEKAKAEMVRAGNDIDLMVQRNAVNIKDPKAKAAVPKKDPRVELVEDSINPQMNVGSKFREVNPKTYQVLAEELPQSAESGGRPASIFDRKRQERSQYLQTDDSTIQKAYGQS